MGQQSVDWGSVGLKIAYFPNGWKQDLGLAGTGFYFPLSQSAWRRSLAPTR